MLSRIIAQLDPTQIQKAADEMAQRDFKWWFAVLFVIGLCAGIYVVRLLLRQQELQRAAHEAERIAHIAATKELTDYLRTDHARAVTTIEKVDSTLIRMVNALERIQSGTTRYLTPPQG
jgi:hypothetical protein